MTSPAIGNITYGGRKGPPDQAARRIDLHLKDQHGRKIHTVFDRMPGAGVIVSYPQFRAPWQLDIQTYLRFSEEAVPNSCWWDYERALTDNRTAWDGFFNEFRTIANRMPGVDAMAAYEAATKGEWSKVPPSVLAEVGITPEPEDYIRAAMVNNKWVLGFTQEVPAWAVPLLTLKMQRESKGWEVTHNDQNKYGDAEVAADVDDMAEAGGMVAGTEKITRRGRPPKERDKE